MTRQRVGGSYSPQRGKPGHCMLAQVWGPDGRSVAEVNATDDPEEATATAQLFAAAPDLLRACRMVAEMAVAWEALTPGDIAEVKAAIAKAGERA